ncbi:helix-turn-helix transcriptional regulator [Oscillospiraceae bacterium 50-58]
MVKPEIVGRVLTEYREREGLTQEVFSGLAGLDRTHYSKLERGLRIPTLDTLFKIGQALDIAPHIILQSIEEAHYEAKI